MRIYDNDEAMCEFLTYNPHSPLHSTHMLVHRLHAGDGVLVKNTSVSQSMAKMVRVFGFFLYAHGITYVEDQPLRNKLFIIVWTSLCTTEHSAYYKPAFEDQPVYNSVNHCKQCQLRNKLFIIVLTMSWKPCELRNSLCIIVLTMPVEVHPLTIGQPFYYSVNHIIVDQALRNSLLEDQHDQPVYYSVNHCNKFEDQPVYYNVNHCKPFQFQASA
ncbi:hypothetical protein DPMN_127148 [Dreissena polymorpha]|uniref:Uncharacterized protein n=1 Tax=Dreissena polymorpha TaxID=45954 RepID=A0A9D4JW94_DREPO|nr:hypothetical protein DPMN_127148 [Dreissena polymorpha]